MIAPRTAPRSTAARPGHVVEVDLADLPAHVRRALEATATAAGMDLPHLLRALLDLAVGDGLLDGFASAGTSQGSLPR